VQKIWIEFNRPSPELGQNKKKTSLQGMDFQKYFSQEIHVECLLLEMI
jgi:predicted DNA binding CopG/RHH family protein